MRPVQVHGCSGDLGRVGLHGHLAPHEVPNEGREAHDLIRRAHRGPERQEESEIPGVDLRMGANISSKGSRLRKGTTATYSGVGNAEHGQVLPEFMPNDNIAFEEFCGLGLGNSKTGGAYD